MGTVTQPLVSIGMPVYNGEKFLRKALTALLAQDYRNFELIISDNRSTDATEEICREFEASDPRIRYIRQPENRGSPWNFNFVLEQAQGDYFMWAAHDDMWRLTYIGQCLRTLEAHPDAVLCCTEVNFIGENDEPLPIYQGWKNLNTLGMTPVERIHRLISVMGWYAIYGLLRPAAIRKIPLGSGRFGIDVVITLQLLLQGHIVKVDERLFYSRIAKSKSAADYQVDFNPEKNISPPTPVPYTDLASDLLETVYKSNLSWEEKTAVFADFIRTMTAQSNDRFWRQQITQELLGAGAALNDAGFAFMLAKILARSVPLSEIRRNPLVQAVYAPPPAAPDVLGLANNMPAPRTEGRALAAERHREGIAFFEQGKVEEASRLFAEALKQDETADYWVDWSTAQITRRRTAEAEQGLRRALTLNANHTLAALKLGILMASAGRFKDALPFFDRCFAALPDSQRSDVGRLREDCRAKAAALA